MSKRHFVNPLNPLRVQGSDEKTVMQKFNTHCFPSIRPVPVPLDKGSHSLGHSTISWITLHFYHCFYDSTPRLLPQHNSEAEGARNSDEVTALSISEPWPRALGRGLCHPGLGLWSWFLPLLLERWWWPQPWEEHYSSAASSVEEAMEQSEQGRTAGGCISTETLKFHKSEPHKAKIEETAEHCTQRISGWRLPRWGLRKTIQRISNLWQQKESLQMCPSKTIILPGMLLKDWWIHLSYISWAREEVLR